MLEISVIADFVVSFSGQTHSLIMEKQVAAEAEPLFHTTNVARNRPVSDALESCSDC